MVTWPYSLVLWSSCAASSKKGLTGVPGKAHKHCNAPIGRPLKLDIYPRACNAPIGRPLKLDIYRRA